MHLFECLFCDKVAVVLVTPAMTVNVKKKKLGTALTYRKYRNVVSSRIKAFFSMECLKVRDFLWFYGFSSIFTYYNVVYPLSNSPLQDLNNFKNSLFPF